MISNTIYCTLPHSLGSFIIVISFIMVWPVTVQGPSVSSGLYLLGQQGRAAGPGICDPRQSLRWHFLWRWYIYVDVLHAKVFTVEGPTKCDISDMFSQDFSKIPQLWTQIMTHWFVGIMYKLTTVKSSQPCQSNRSNRSPGMYETGNSVPCSMAARQGTGGGTRQLEEGFFAH